MAATGGPASLITQVSQGGPPPINTLQGIQDTKPEKAGSLTLVQEARTNTSHSIYGRLKQEQAVKKD